MGGVLFEILGEPHGNLRIEHGEVDLVVDAERAVVEIGGADGIWNVVGSNAFVGGAGYADWWRFGTNGEPRWRDTMVRVQGDAVRGLQGAFVENWLEASGEILDGPDPQLNTDPGSATALVVSSTPSSGGSTRSRVLFQTLIAAARKSIYITTPYFLPDGSMRNELVRAQKRGVTGKVIVPGKHDDHTLTRSSGGSAYGDLLKAEANIYEYESSMIHAKVTIIAVYDCDLAVRAVVRDEPIVQPQTVIPFHLTACVFQ